MQTALAMYVLRRLKPYSVYRYQDSPVQYTVLLQNPRFFRLPYPLFEVSVKSLGFYLVQQPVYLVVARYFLHPKYVFRILSLVSPIKRFLNSMSTGKTDIP
jgi:hypothetical protein